VGASLDFEDFEPDTLTRTQLLEARGYPAEIVNGKPGPQLCGLPGCDRPVSPGRGAKFCSEAHRRKASHQRNGRSSRSPTAARDSGLGPPSVGLPGDLFEMLQGLPLLLRRGWTVQADSSAVHLHWTV
jgi:hypothetical protein